MDPRSLYIHVPFCARRCFYCDFAVQAVREPPVTEWIGAIARELELTAVEQGWKAPLALDTLYVGGGTPSLLGVAAMERLREALSPLAELVDGAEWTCEANPESFDVRLAEDWARAGVNRLSLGTQTFSPDALRWMGRLHGPEGPGRAIQAAREAGIENISIDLIFGLPDHLDRSWGDDLDRTLALGPSHVSLYGLTAEAGAPLGRRVAEGRESLADEDRYADEYLLAHDRLTAAGFEHYEVSNFARPGARSRHNAVYWTGAPYAALGPGAHALYPPLRRWNVRAWEAYRDTIAAGAMPVDDQEVVDEESGALEAVWLGLRTAEGYPLDRLTAGARARVQEWERQKLAILHDGCVALTAAGWLLLDRLSLDLAEPEEAASGRRSRRIDGSQPLVQISTTSNP